MQGADELSGDALEVAMDIEFTVSLEPGGSPPAPRMENADYLMASGIAGSIDDAFRGATANMVRWLDPVPPNRTASDEAVGTASGFAGAGTTAPSFPQPCWTRMPGSGRGSLHTKPYRQVSWCI